ncbi:hypothetical protein CN689_26850 [Peribacillus butanolivorans]|uniref:Uncharacterized protein n=1 Tax=Peribacillus butanolivorans TaxID=421767 RepID=A0AAX0RVC5_9BACI|nr:hypothetical protein [Peribacillus butanolivorans]AXN40742.1 hypothetical protein DTO10_21765 [Peribacillus butanolivorans]PEJ24889.1 hypothetical protein CN689_26850 [Peribacillus butanolivorans]
MWYKILFLLVMVNTFYNGQSMTTVFAESKKVISKPKEANVILYANIDRKNGMYRDLDMKIDEGTRYFPYWVNVTNPSYAPRILYNDLNQDKKKDLTIV